MQAINNRILEASGANIVVDPIEVGEKEYLSGSSAGINQEAWGIPSIATRSPSKLSSHVLKDKASKASM